MRIALILAMALPVVGCRGVPTYNDVANYYNTPAKTPARTEAPRKPNSTLKTVATVAVVGGLVALVVTNPEAGIVILKALD